MNIPLQHIGLHFAQKTFHSGYAGLWRLYRISNRVCIVAEDLDFKFIIDTLR
jgi:hypothetical protein